MADSEKSPAPSTKNRSKSKDGELRVIGVPRRRVDARAKVTGQTRFADDIAFPRMAYCKLLRSPHAHARIRKIGTTRARSHPGVYLVLTGKDVPIEYGILPVSQDEQALCVDHVRHVGDPVAAVIAREELTAFEALDLIDVEYEVLAPICDPEEALANPEPRIHSYGEEGNIHKRVALAFGDVEQGFAEADEVFEDVFFYQGNTHLPIEQHAAVAVKDPDGKLTIWSSTQTPHYLHRALAKVLNMPHARRGFLLSSRPPSRADEVQNRRQEGWHNHRNASSNAHRWRRLRFVWCRQYVLHGRAANDDVPCAPLPL